MRVTSQSFPNALMGQLGRLNTRQSALQTQVATGQRIQLPEDDPAAVQRVLNMQAEARSAGQYQKNIDRLLEQSNAAFGSIKSLKLASDRAGEIATLADGTKGPEQLKAYAVEVEQLLEQAVNAANAKFNGDYLFGGTRAGDSPFVAERDAGGKITGVSYRGGSEVMECEIAEGSFITAQTLGANNSGSGARGLLADTRTGADFFGHLISLRDQLQAGNTAAISAETLPNLQKDEESLVFHYGTAGATQGRLEATRNILTSRASSLEALVSHEVDADLAQTMVQLSDAQNAYRAALQSGATILNTSLLDFLR